MFAAAQTHRSVHYVVASTSPGRRQTMVCDVAATRGIQRITFTRQGALGRLTILLVKRTAYVRGNAVGLHYGVNLVQHEASRYAHRWISVPHGEFSYQMLADGLTLGSFLHDHVPEGRLTYVGSEIGGEKVVGVRGDGTTSTVTVYARSSARPLPIEATTFDPARAYRERATIDRWNEAVRVQAPAHAVPMAKVLGIS